MFSSDTIPSTQASVGLGASNRANRQLFLTASFRGLNGQLLTRGSPPSLTFGGPSCRWLDLHSPYCLAEAPPVPLKPTSSLQQRVSLAWEAEGRVWMMPSDRSFLAAAPHFCFLRYPTRDPDCFLVDSVNCFEFLFVSSPHLQILWRPPQCRGVIAAVQLSSPIAAGLLELVYASYLSFIICKKPPPKWDYQLPSGPDLGATPNRAPPPHQPVQPPKSTSPTAQKPTMPASSGQQECARGSP